MRKIYSLVLMATALLIGTNVWAVEVSDLAGLKSALATGGDITLIADIDAGTTGVTFASGTATLDLGEFTLSSSVTASGDNQKGTLIISGGSLTVKGTGSITGANGNAIYMSAGSLLIKSGTITGVNEGIFAIGGSISVEGGAIIGVGDNAIWSRGDALTISNGTFTGGWGALQADNNIVLTITGGEFTGVDQDVYMNAWSSIANPSPSCSISGGTFNGNGIIVGSGSLLVTGGTFAVNPVSYLDVSSYVAILEDDKYVVSAPAADVVAYNQNKLATYASLSAAVEDASASDVIYLYKNDASAVTVAKNITIKTNGHSTNLSAGAGYSRADMGKNVVFTDNAIAAFLMADGTAFLTVSEDANIASAGAIHVNGTKTLTINKGVTVTYKRQGSDGNIVVDKDAKLTVLGSGTFAPQMHSETNTVNGFTVETSTTASNQVGNRAIDVAVGGELVVGVKDDANNCPHFITSSIARGSAVSVSGKATFNNANIQAACASIWNYGSVIINSGEYVSVATSQNGINGGWYSYNLRNDAGSNLVINDGHFVGTQGSVAVYAGATADINGGYFETVHGYNYKTGAANEKDHHYALYVAREAIVNVYNGYFKVATPSAGGGKVILSGNDDAYNTYGVINIYGGYFQRKADVQDKKNGESSYPTSIPKSSAWYSSFGTEAPLPAGYEYYETDDAEYPYGVRPIAGKETAEIESTETTIPWQQSTTWAEGEVPENNTIVTIPVGKTVIVSKDEAEKEAMADQIFINQGASLTVQEGTTLSVGDGGVNIANGGSVTVEPGAIVKIGANGVITAEEEALVLESTEDAQAVLLYDPAVAENTQPKATIKLKTNSKQLSKDPWIYTYQRFAIPVKEAMIPENDFAAKVEAGTDEVFAADAARVNGEFQSYVYYWDGANAKWANCKWKDLKPFYGYQLANNSTYGGVTYTFNGNLFGNEDKAFAFEAKGFEYFGNSYTAPIYIKSFLENLKEANPAVEATVWLYNYNNSQYGSVTLDQLSDPTVVAFLGLPTEIKSMDAFVLRLRNANEGSAPVDYSDAIWSNPNVNPSAAVSGAPARNMSTSDSKIAAIEVVDGNGNSDRVILMENEAYTNGFDNGADAAKFMSKGGIDLYASTNEGELSCVAADDMNKTLISFKSGDATSYTLNFKAMNTDYMLRDNVANTVVAVEEGATYTFNQAANTTVPARFEIIAAAKVPTSIENVEAAAKASGIYSITGQFLGNDFSVLPAGVYVVNGVKIVK